MEKDNSNLNDLKKAYIESSYEIFKPNFKLKIGVSHPSLDEFLIDNASYTWAFITAYNPYSKLVTLEENEAAHQRLLGLLKKELFTVCEGQGVGNTEEWAPEKSLFILDISLERAIALAQFFEQNAFVFGSVNQVAKLVFCNE